MKLIVLFGTLCLGTSVFSLDLKESFIKAAKDKNNQDQAQEIAKKGVDFIKEKNNGTPETVPVVSPTPNTNDTSSTLPIVKKKEKKNKSKKTKH